MSLPREKIGLALGVIGVGLFSGTLPATRLAVSGFDPLFLTAGRATIAGCAGLALLLATRRKLPSPRLCLEFLVTGVFTILAFPIFMALGMQSVPASHGGVVLGILPLATVALATLVTHERPSAGFWIASVAGALIVLIFVTRKTGTIAIAAGDLYLLGAVIGGAGAYALSGRLSARMPGWEVISWQVALFLPLMALASYFLWPADIAQAPAKAWAGFAYVATVSMYLAFFVFNAAMAMAGIARVGQLMLLQPFVVVALSIPVNGESFDIDTVLFAALVVATVLIGQRMRVRRG